LKGVSFRIQVKVIFPGDLLPAFEALPGLRRGFTDSAGETVPEQQKPLRQKFLHSAKGSLFL
jgi:hypothetical protein